MEVKARLEAEEKQMRARHAAIRAILRNFAKLTGADKSYVIGLLQDAKDGPK